MLFNNLTTERRASLLVKDSYFYIEIAKFVQAYTTIVKNPNEFLVEIGEQPINSKSEHLNWEQLVKIMQKVDLGFNKTPTRMDLIVFYNYALEMGSVKALEKKVASVDEVAEAQKHYYNFIDEEKTNAEEEYRRQKKIFDARQREMSYVDGHISAAKAKNVLTAICMFLSVVIGIVGIVSFFVDNIIASGIGKLIPIWKAQYIGAIVLIVLMFLLFSLFNRLYLKTKYEYVKLKTASLTIFAREDELAAKQTILKKKLDEVTRDYETAMREINDKTKKFDVKHNIDVLKATNKFYQKLCEADELVVSSQRLAADKLALEDEDFAPIKLTKEQEENLNSVKSEVIGLEGQIDKDAYNEKFEKSSKKSKKEQEKEEAQEEQEIQEKQEKEEIQENKSKIEEDLAKQVQEQKLEQERKGFQESIDYVKGLLGLNENPSSKEK